MAKKVKKEEERALSVPSNSLAPAPAYMQVHGMQGLENVNDFCRPPYIKIVQKQSSDELLDTYGRGSAVLLPDGVVLIDGEELLSFEFTPVFFFPQWCTWNPIERRGKEPSIRESSFDRKSALAAKSRDKNLWSEEHPDDPKLKIRHVEHLNFIVYLYGHDMFAMMSFARGEHKRGTQLLSMARARKAPIFAGRYVAETQDNSNDQGEWIGFKLSNADPTWVDEELFEKFRAANEEYHTLHENQLIQVDHGEEAISPSEEKSF